MLSAIILVALKGMLLQFHDLPKFWANSRLDGVLWLSVFAAVLVLDIDSGLIIGIVVAVLILIYRGYDTKIKEVGRVLKIKNIRER